VRSRGIKRLVVLICFSVASCLILLTFWNHVRHTPEDQSVIAVPVPQPVSPATDNPVFPESTFTALVFQNTADAAVVVLMQGDHNGKVVAGRRIKPGVLKLDNGYVQLEFFSGAVVGLIGPAELRIESKDAATLLSGKVTAHVPERARGFVLNAPSAAVVDLGTEFGVRIDETGITEVEVLSGEVELSLLGDDGNTLLSARVDDSKTVSIDTLLKKQTEIPGSPDDFPRIRLSDDTPLSISDSLRNCSPRLPTDYLLAI
jgi:hypothetical protein